MNRLSLARQARVVACLAERNSIRSTERLTDTNQKTIMRLLSAVGAGCRRLHNDLFRDLNVSYLELDEIWAFVAMKQGHLAPGDDPSFGDQYTYTALDANRKAIIAYRVGKRDGETTRAFVQDVRGRILNRPQITSDGYAPYIPAVEIAFGIAVDYAQVVKHYTDDPIGAEPGQPMNVAPNRTPARRRRRAPETSERRYSPGSFLSASRRKIVGEPDTDHVSTSFVERSNLTVRMRNRRFTRLTNAFSKTLAGHEASLDLFVAHYNLCAIHSTLRMTPAMAMGVTQHLWSVEDLVAAALALPCPREPREPEPAEEPVIPTRIWPSLTVVPGRGWRRTER